MATNRTRFQGLSNIVRFNWHFYLIAGFLIVVLTIFSEIFPTQFQDVFFWIGLFSGLSILVSLVVSHYIYDRSDLYEMTWFDDPGYCRILNINAGFDETSHIIRKKAPNSYLTICDFYDPSKHTEVSIKRARKAFPPEPETIKVETEKLPFATGSFDIIFVTFSAHEIRDARERHMFFREINRVANSDCRIYVTEHLRDFFNFAAYTVGFFHFYSRNNWLNCFAGAKLKVIREQKTTLFITTFILGKDGDPL
mgnify:CR=1 FL=1